MKCHCIEHKQCKETLKIGNSPNIVQTDFHDGQGIELLVTPRIPQKERLFGSKMDMSKPNDWKVFFSSKFGICYKHIGSKQNLCQNILHF